MKRASSESSRRTWSCLKLAEDSGDHIVRVYDATGAGSDAELTFSFNIKEASEVDMLEKEQEYPKKYLWLQL